MIGSASSEPKLRLGEILVKAGVIDDLQLRAALGEQVRWGSRLGMTLIRMGMVEEGDLIRALARQLDLPVATLSGKKIPDEVLALVPARVAAEHNVMPLFTRKGSPCDQLYLGMEDPSNLAVLDDLTFRTGMEVHPVMVGPTDLHAALDRCYRHFSSSDSGAGPSPLDLDPPFDENREDPLGEMMGETLGETNLRSVEGNPVHEASTRVVTPALRERAPATPVAVQNVVVSEDLPPQSPERSIVTTIPDVLLDKIADTVKETERTRIVVKAVTQLLIEKGILTLDEVQDQIAKLKAESEESAIVRTT